jgi:hypothetical protein
VPVCHMTQIVYKFVVVCVDVGGINRPLYILEGCWSQQKILVMACARMDSPSGGYYGQECSGI